MNGSDLNTINLKRYNLTNLSQRNMKKEFLILFLIIGLFYPIYGILESDRLKRLIRIDLNNPLAKDACDYPLDIGRCFAAKQRFYFNGDTCEQFTYKGCLGNANNFRTKEECMLKCAHKMDGGSGEIEKEHFSFSLFG